MISICRSRENPHIFEIHTQIFMSFSLTLLSINFHNNQTIREKKNLHISKHFWIKYLDVLIKLCTYFLAVGKNGIIIRNLQKLIMRNCLWNSILKSLCMAPLGFKWTFHSVEVLYCLTYTYTHTRIKIRHNPGCFQVVSGQYLGIRVIRYISREHIHQLAVSCDYENRICYKIKCNICIIIEPRRQLKVIYK